MYICIYAYCIHVCIHPQATSGLKCFNCNHRLAAHTHKWLDCLGPGSGLGCHTTTVLTCGCCTKTWWQHQNKKKQNKTTQEEAKAILFRYGYVYGVWFDWRCPSTPLLPFFIRRWNAVHKEVHICAIWFPWLHIFRSVFGTSCWKFLLLLCSPLLCTPLLTEKQRAATSGWKCAALIAWQNIV